MAPNFSVTGFQLSSTRKPKPNWRSAGQEPWISEMMMPERMISTAMAAALVRNRKELSLKRSLLRTLARSDDAASVIAPLAGYATSTTGFLPEEVIRLSMQSQLQVRRG